MQGMLLLTFLNLNIETMKYKLLFVFCVAVVTGLSAQNKKENQVKEAVTQLTKALISGDSTELSAITSEKLSYGHSGGAVENKQEFIAKVVSGKSHFVTIDIAEQTISLSGKTALVRHLLNATNIDNGKPGSIKLKVLLVFQLERGQWKVLARQAVKF